MRHTWTALAMAGFLGISGLTPAFTLEAQAAYAMENGAYRMGDGTAIDGVVSRGIDVSRWQGDINWTAVAADDVEFVFLRALYSEGVDPNFVKNMEGATAAGLKVGVYLYTQVTTSELISAEADKLLDLIKDYPVSYPVVFDAEASTLAALSPQEVSQLINIFCKKIQDAGYYPMVYTNDYWLTHEIDLSQMNYDVWVARYGAKPVYSKPVIWQATQEGTVAGISGKVDINFQYRDLSSKLPANLWRTIGGTTYYYQNYVMQKNAWIDDGTGWFYMGADAQAQKGWQKIDGNYYYLDDTTGRMATGWLNQNDSWYYLGDSGIMATGWHDIGDGRYYLNEQGVRQAGWHTAGDVDYYLNPADGKMARGWLQIDSSWYYFDGSGQKQAGVLNLDGAMYYLDQDTGIMAVSTTMTIDGTDYTIDASGVCTPVVVETTEAETTAPGETQAPADGAAPSETVVSETTEAQRKGPGA